MKNTTKESLLGYLFWFNVVMFFVNLVVIGITQNGATLFALIAHAFAAAMLKIQLSGKTG